jgi:hypothetical protein
MKLKKLLRFYCHNIDTVKFQQSTERLQIRFRYLLITASASLLCKVEYILGIKYFYTVSYGYFLQFYAITSQVLLQVPLLLDTHLQDFVCFFYLPMLITGL